MVIVANKPGKDRFRLPPTSARESAAIEGYAAATTSELCEGIKAYSDTAVCVSGEPGDTDVGVEGRPPDGGLDLGK